MTALEQVALALAKLDTVDVCTCGPYKSPIDVIAAMTRRGWVMVRFDMSVAFWHRTFGITDENCNWKDANSISEAIYKASLRALESEKK